MTIEMLTLVLSYLPEVLAYIALFFCVTKLIRYRLKRKFKKERPKNRREFMDHNIVELEVFAMYVGLVTPQWITFWIQVFN